jgi:spore maturation protein CgeB
MMTIVVFGLAISSGWGNGHATLWRGLCRALGARGHRVTFFERDVPYYAAHRDVLDPEGCDLVLYDSWHAISSAARRVVDDADVGMVTSYCPDAGAACELLLDSRARLKLFYDLDTPVTLDRLSRGEQVEYVPACGLGPFDLVLSYAGGRALDELRSRLGARVVAPLYGSVDPDVHRPVGTTHEPRWAMSYLGTYSPDRQSALDELFLGAARRRPTLRFSIAGSMYPGDFPWLPNVHYLAHLPPTAHAGFYSSSNATLNVTRGPMAEIGYCPSGRLFEAAACGTPTITDRWPGIETFFEPEREILVADTTDDTLAALDMDPQIREGIGRAARARTLAEHTAARRAVDLERAIDDVWRGQTRPRRRAVVAAEAVEQVR